MATKVSDVTALLHPRASKVPSSQVWAFLNYEVLEDILPGLMSTWPDEFIGFQEITIDTATATEYSLSSDFRRRLEVKDQNNNDVNVERVSSIDPDVKDSVLFTFDGSGDPVVQVNSNTKITKLIIRYEKTFTKIVASDDNLPFPEHINKQILPILAKGVSYFYLRSRKKTADVQFVFNEYEDLKANIFEGSIIEL